MDFTSCSGFEDHASFYHEEHFVHTSVELVQIQSGHWECDVTGQAKQFTKISQRSEELLLIMHEILFLKFHNTGTMGY